MSAALKAKVRQGRLVLDEPSELPEGTEVSLVPRPDPRHSPTWEMIEEIIERATPEDIAHYRDFLAGVLSVRGPDDEETEGYLRGVLKERLAETGPMVSVEELFARTERARRAALAR